MLLNQGKFDFSKMRNLQQMGKDGMCLSSPSNEVAKLWDSVMFQSYGFFDAPEVDGIQGSIARIRSIDPYCPLLKTVSIEVTMKNFEDELSKLKLELNDQIVGQIRHGRKWTQFEKTQIQAFIYQLEGYDDLALDILYKQIAKNPCDIMSLKQAIPITILKGTSSDIATMAGICCKDLSTNSIYYSFVRSYEAYGIEERGQYDLALNMAKESLEICPWNSWGTHTMAHIFDSQGQPESGLKFMNGNRKEWMPCNLLSCHNNWHMGLFQLDASNVSAALEIWDTEIVTNLEKQFSSFHMSDAVSLLMRIEMEQISSNADKKEVDISGRFEQLFGLIKQALEQDSCNNFYDAHLAMAMMCSRRKDLLERMKSDIDDWVSKYENRIFEKWEINPLSQLYSSGIIKSNKYVTRTRALIPFIKALEFLDGREYQEAVNVLYPFRDQFRILGGSKAQNDVFDQVLACTLLAAGGEENNSFLKMLIFDRRAERARDDYGDRMLARIINDH